MGKSWAIGKRLWFLTIFFCLLLVGEGTFLNFHLNRMAKINDDLAHVSLPAIRNMTLADMMHDGTKAVVYQALHAAHTKDKPMMSEVKAEAEEMAKNFNDYIGELDKISLSPEIKTSLEQAKVKINEYSADAQKLIGYAESYDVAAAEKELKTFNALFGELEESLGKLGEDIEREAGAIVVAAEKQAKFAIWIGVLAIAFGVVFGFIFSLITNRAIIKALGTTVTHLTEQMHRWGQSSRRISVVSGELSTTANQQAAAIQETASSVEEINSMAKATAANTQKLSSVAKSSGQSVQDGQKAVSQMLTAMNEIRRANGEIVKQVEDGNKQIEEIVKVIGEIGEKTKVINEIVFQTKLLSFNASVEAARAGEHGKGFAVVAEEVGNLARMSGESAKEISTMLQMGIERANQIVHSTRTRVERLMGEGTQKIEQGTGLAESCGRTFEQIVGQSKEFLQMSADIGAAINEQAHGINEISKAVNLFDQTAKENSQTAHTVQATSNDIESSFNQLGDVVATLRELSDVKAVHGSPSETAAGEVVSVMTEMTREQQRVSTPKLKKASGSDLVPERYEGEFEDL